jgi:hypothetical protein
MRKIISITQLPNRFLPVAPVISFKKNLLWVLSLCLFSFSLHARADYALQDGDTIAFLGDSITAARQYSKIIEDYTCCGFRNAKSGSSTPAAAAKPRKAAWPACNRRFSMST